MKTSKVLSLAALLFSCAVLGALLWRAGVELKILYAPYAGLAVASLVAFPVFSRELVGPRFACSAAKTITASLIFGVVGGLAAAVLVSFFEFASQIEVASFSRAFLVSGIAVVAISSFVIPTFVGISHAKFAVIEDYINRGQVSWRVYEETDVTYLLRRKDDQLVLLKDSQIIREIHTCCGEVIKK